MVRSLEGGKMSLLTTRYARLSTFTKANEGNDLATDADLWVYVLVGPEEEAFLFHRRLICESSPYFAAALAGNFNEPHWITRLSETDTETFKLVHAWLYNGTFPSPYNDASFHISVYRRCQTVLLKLWVFADMVLMPKLQNAAMNALHQAGWAAESAPVEGLRYVFHNTVAASPLRHYVIDAFIHDLGSSRLTEDIIHEINTDEIICELLKAMVARNVRAYKAIKPSLMDLNKYYVKV